MWPSWELHMLERERGELPLELADGSRERISDKHLTFKLQGPTEQRMSVYRLRILPSVPEHLAAGYEEPAAAGAAEAPSASAVEDAARGPARREDETKSSEDAGDVRQLRDWSTARACRRGTSQAASMNGQRRTRGRAGTRSDVERAGNAETSRTSWTKSWPSTGGASRCWAIVETGARSRMVSRC